MSDFITDFEMDEQVFPAGDGELAQWKRRANLRYGEVKRYIQAEEDRCKKQLERIERVRAFGAEAKRRAGGRGGAIAEAFLDPDEFAELAALQMAISAFMRESDRRQAASCRYVPVDGHMTAQRQDGSP